MKNITKKILTITTIMAMVLTLAMPMQAQAASKKAPKINKTKVTLTITKKKTKPAYTLKVKNTYGKRVKWTTSNKKVATISKNGKVTAKKAGTAVVKAKVGNKTLKCKIIVKDTRKTGNKPSNKPVCNHEWVKVYKDVQVEVPGESYAVTRCVCGLVFKNHEDWQEHTLAMAEAGIYEGHSNTSYIVTDPPTYKTEKVLDYEYCKKCGVKK